MIKTYSELITIPTFEERFEYLRIGGTVGEDTFGFNRYLNQIFYNSPEYKRFRDDIIIRDNGCDLGIKDRKIAGIVVVHHIIPITVDDVLNRRVHILLNPENAISTSKMTHKAIHYGDKNLLIADYVERTKYDTCPWRR